MECNTWVERETLPSMGYSKLVNKKNEQEVAAAGLMSKSLTQPSAEKALKDLFFKSTAGTSALWLSLRVIAGMSLNVGRLRQ